MIRSVNALSVTGSALALLCTAAAVPAQDAVTLRYKIGKDDRIIVQKSQTVKQTQTVGAEGMSQTFENEIKSTDITLRTLERVDPEENLHLLTENKLLKVEMKIGPLGEYTYDSTAMENEKASAIGAALTPIYDRLSGAILRIVQSPRGEIVEVKGYEDLISDLVKDNPLASQFTAGGTDAAARMTLAEFFPVLPKDAVKPGDTWEEPYELDLPRLGKARGKRIYKYAGPDKVGGRETARIEVTTELAFDLDLDMAGAKVGGTLTIKKSKGTVQFDPKQGQVVSMKNEYELAGELTVTAGDKDIPVETKQTQTVSLQLLEKLPE